MRPERRGLVALDGDGVLVDYVKAYGAAWAKYRGCDVSVADPDAYFPHHHWGVPWLEGADLQRFQSFFDTEFWSSIPAIDGALEACRLLVENGCDLVCVTALHHDHRDARQSNLTALGFPIGSVHTTPHSNADMDGSSPKASFLEQLKPVAFVDDFLPYMRGVSSNIHRALIMRGSNGSPNSAYAGSGCVDSAHATLLDFARWWVADDSAEGSGLQH